MEEEQVQQDVQRIHTMERGDYYILDPAWEGQHTLYISRPDERQRWIFISTHSKKTKRKEIVQILLTCAALIGGGYLAFRYGYISQLFFNILAGLGVFAPIIIILANQKKTVIECDPWHLKLNRRDVFKSIKGQWKPEEIAGFRFVESGLSVPATCTQMVYDLQLNLKNGQIVPLLNWQDHGNLSWIADGLNQILGLDIANSQESPQLRDAAAESNREKTNIETIEDAILALPKAAGLKFSTDIIEDEEEGPRLEIRFWLANWRLSKLFKPLAVVFFVLGLALCITLIIMLAESNIESRIAVNLIIGGITLITAVIVIAGAFLWATASELKNRKVICTADERSIWLWSGNQWIEINPKQLRQLAVVSTNTSAYYVGLGIAGRKWLSFGKAYAIEMTTLENMITIAELPFDQPECQWICDVMEEMKKVMKQRTA